LRSLINGYNPIFLSNGFKRISFFLLERINEFSIPISNNDQLLGVLKTSIGRKINAEMFDLLKNCVTQFERDGLILVEENTSEKNEVEIVQGIEIDRGFASSYFVNDLKNFEVVYECQICFPVAGMKLNCVAKNITKAGIRAESSETDESPFVLFVARDHHF
jgi:chaperonin GroEL